MILVTGATGTVGSKVVRALLDKGVPFRAGVHTRPLEVDGVETRTIDFDRQGTLPPVLEGARDVFLASYAILQEQAIVPAARDAGVERIVLLRPHRRRGVSVVLDRGGLPEEELDVIVDLSRYARTGATSSVTTGCRILLAARRPRLRSSFAITRLSLRKSGK